MRRWRKPLSSWPWLLGFFPAIGQLHDTGIAIFGAVLKARRRDICLKSFSGYLVYVRLKDGKQIWGQLVTDATGIELQYRADDTLLVGRESAGVPDSVHTRADARVVVPLQPGLRSLNVALAAAMVLGEALRQLDAFPKERP